VKERRSKLNYQAVSHVGSGRLGSITNNASNGQTTADLHFGSTQHKTWASAFLIGQVNLVAVSVGLVPRDTAAPLPPPAHSPPPPPVLVSGTMSRFARLIVLPQSGRLLGVSELNRAPHQLRFELVRQSLGRIILKLISSRVGLWTGFIWLRTKSRGWLLWTRQCSFGLHERRGVSWPAEWLSALMMEAVSTSETSVKYYRTTRRNIPEDSHLHTLRRKNLKSHPINTRFVCALSVWSVPLLAPLIQFISRVSVKCESSASTCHSVASRVLCSVS
jgi:hypothetical protein